VTSSRGNKCRGQDLVQEQLLREDAEDLYENAPIAYFTSLLDGTLLRVNRTLLGWTGYEREELIGRKRLHDLLPPGARIYYETHYAPLLQMQREVREIAVELLRADGTRLPVLMTSTLVRDESGAARVVRTTAFDASDRRRYERELLSARADAESRARAALALAHVAEGVLLVSEDGDVQLMNPAAERIFGRAAAAAVGQTALEALQGWEEISARVTVNGDHESEAAQILPIRVGELELWLSVAAARAGSSTVFTVRDVTGEHRLDQIRSDLVAIVSHELRTPLTGALGAAHTLQGRYDELPDAQRRDLVTMIVEQSQRLASVLDQILLASQLDNDVFDAELQSVDCSEALDAIVRSVDSDARPRLVIDAAAGVAVSADRERLRQVVANLVDNALKYATGTVRLTATERELMVRLTVSDDGPGIPDADRDRVFEKFFRLDPAQRGGVGGTGLGLYIARELTQRMGGRIGLLPRKRGTTVYVDLPRADRRSSAEVG
jgi:PAS domain S-box-containing protein